MTDTAHAYYHRRRQAALTAGTWTGYVDATPVRAHVIALAASDPAVAAAAGLAPDAVWAVRTGARSVVQSATAARLLAVTRARITSGRLDAGGDRWRLRSLMAMGHSPARIADALGLSRDQVRRVISGTQRRVSAAEHAAVLELFSRWWDQRPAQDTPAARRAASMALGEARARNWPTPATLDDGELDRPGYYPRGGWRPATGTGVLC
jgi:hypothetical protein